MTHHEMKKEEKKSAPESMPEYETQMKKRGQEIQEGRKREKEAEAGAETAKRSKEQK